MELGLGILSLLIGYLAGSLSFSRIITKMLAPEVDLAELKITMETAEDERIIQIGAQASEETLGKSAITGVPYGTDASPLVRSGVPCLVLGPGSIDQAHTADEWVDLDQVALCTEMYTRIMLNY